MEIQDWINEQNVEAVQDRTDGKDYWKTDNLYTETDLIEMLEAFAIYGVSSRFKILDKDGVEMPDHYTGRRRNYFEAKKHVDGLNKDGEYRPYRMVQV